MLIVIFRSRKFTDFEGCSSIQDSLLGWSPKELKILDIFSKFLYKLSNLKNGPVFIKKIKNIIY